MPGLPKIPHRLRDFAEFMARVSNLLQRAGFAFVSAILGAVNALRRLIARLCARLRIDKARFKRVPYTLKKFEA